MMDTMSDELHGEPSTKKRRLDPSSEAEVAQTGGDEPDYFQDDDGLDSLDDADWDGLLPDQAERASQMILSPPNVERKTPRGDVDGSPIKARSRPLLPDQPSDTLRGGRAPCLDEHADVGDDEDDEPDYAAQEAALAAKYGYSTESLARFGVGAKAGGFGATAIESPAPGAQSGAGFTSARGKQLAPPSEASLQRALAITHSPPNTKDSATTETTRSVLQVIGRDASLDTPLLHRGNSSSTANTSLQPRANNGFTPFRAPSSAANAVAVQARSEKPSIQPLRYGPKGKSTLLQPRRPEAMILHHAPGSGSAAEKASNQLPVDDPREPTPDDMGILMDVDKELDVEPEHEFTGGAPQPPRQTTSSYPGLTTGAGRPVEAPPRDVVQAIAARLTSHETSLSRSSSPVAETQPSETPTSRSGGLMSASGKPIAMPSREGVERLQRLLAGAKDHRNGDDTRMPTAAAEASASLNTGFTSGAGKPVAMPSPDAVAKQLAKLNGHGQDSLASTSGLTSGGGRPISAPAPASVAKALERLEDPAGIVTPLRPVLAKKNGNASHITQTQAVAPSTPSNADQIRSFRSPLQTLTKQFRIPTRAVTGTPANHEPPATPSQFTRLNLEMRPRNTPKSATNRSTFKTPFKNGIRPTQQQLSESKEKPKGLPPDQLVFGSQAAPAKQRDPTSRDSVFDLTNMPKKRLGLRKYGLNPFYTADSLIEQGLPNDVIFMTLPKALDYRFVVYGEAFGYELAHEELVKYSGCSSKHVTLEWVKNHWGLIVWKLAGTVRAKPDEVSDLWRFDKVCEQLKYRYEREYQQGQRSCIKRIQERDSPASIPLVLLVTQILYEEKAIPPQPGSDEEIQGIVLTEQVPCGLEMSDGWYRIRTNIDEALFRAIFFRNIFPGQKIAIQGAKTDGATEGAEPLEAYESSTLVVSGNSTSRVPWDAKLGFQRRKMPFICTFRSLLPDGGLVPFLDVVVSRIYNVGYKGEFVEGEGQDVWNEEEERERQASWEKEREKIVHDVRISQQRHIAKVCDIESRLKEAAACCPKNRVKDESLVGTDATDVFALFEEEPEKMPGLIMRLDKDMLSDTLEYTSRKIEIMQNNMADEMRKELDTRCPPRIARQFIIIRVTDHHKEATGEGRDCVLNVVDPSKLGDGLLQVGKRFLVSNLYPGRPTAWSGPKVVAGEIFLNTRFDTRWQQLPV